MNPPDDLLNRAERVYERGRIAKGLRAATLVLPLMLLSFGCCGKPSTSLMIGAVLAALTTVLVWRGGSIGRAVGPGFAAGIAPLVIPVLACPACTSAGMTGTVPLLACAAGGLASGAIIVFYGTREREDRASFVFAAGAIAALAGSLGCVIVGLGGVVAMAAGLAIATPLALRAAPAR